MLKAVIMDFDGVVIDTEAVWYDVYKEWFKQKVNYELKLEEFLLCVGSNYENLFEELERTKDMHINHETFFDDTMKLFVERSNQLPPLEGTTDFIKSVKKSGLQLSLATSATLTKPMKHLTRLGLINYFDYLVTADDVERIKPFPDLFNTAADKLGVKKDEVIVVEDSSNGLIAANKAGIKTIIVPNKITQHSNFTHYYKKVSSLKEINMFELITEFDR